VEYYIEDMLHCVSHYDNKRYLICIALQWLQNPEEKIRTITKSGQKSLALEVIVLLVKQLSAAGRENKNQNKKAGSRGGSPRKGWSGRVSLPAGSKGRSP
jgi:hypothetical protein